MAVSCLIYSSVEGSQRGQNQEQECIRCRVQREIKSAVHQNREATSHRSRCHPAPELVFGFAPREAFAKKNEEKTNTKQSANNAAVRQCLQIIVVRLLKSIEAVA